MLKFVKNLYLKFVKVYSKTSQNLLFQKKTYENITKYAARNRSNSNGKAESNTPTRGSEMQYGYVWNMGHWRAVGISGNENYYYFRLIPTFPSLETVLGISWNSVWFQKLLRTVLIIPGALIILKIIQIIVIFQKFSFLGTSSGNFQYQISFPGIAHHWSRLYIIKFS